MFRWFLNISKKRELTTSLENFSVWPPSWWKYFLMFRGKLLILLCVHCLWVYAEQEWKEPDCIIFTLSFRYLYIVRITLMLFPFSGLSSLSSLTAFPHSIGAPIYSPSLWPFTVLSPHAYVSLAMTISECDTILQVWPHQFRIEWKALFPPLAGNILSNAVQDTIFYL